MSRVRMSHYYKNRRSNYLDEGLSAWGDSSHKSKTLSKMFIIPMLTQS